MVTYIDSEINLQRLNVLSENSPSWRQERRSSQGWLDVPKQSLPAACAGLSQTVVDVNLSKLPSRYGLPLDMDVSDPEESPRSVQEEYSAYTKQ